MAVKFTNRCHPPKTAYVGVDQEWVLRVLKRVAADLDQLSGNLFPTSEDDVGLEAIVVDAPGRERRRY